MRLLRPIGVLQNRCPESWYRSNGPACSRRSTPKSFSHRRLAAADLGFDAGQAYVVYDGRELRACRDATAAIAAVVRAKRPCSAVDLSAIRMAGA